MSAPLPRSTVVAFTVAVVLTSCGSEAPADQQSSRTNSVTVIATDVAYDAQTYRSPAGEIEFTLIQEGQIPHTLAIEDNQGTDLGLDLTVNANRRDASETIQLEPGTYTLWCTIPGHRELGQQATLIIT